MMDWKAYMGVKYSINNKLALKFVDCTPASSLHAYLEVELLEKNIVL